MLREIAYQGVKILLSPIRFLLEMLNLLFRMSWFVTLPLLAGSSVFLPYALFEAVFHSGKKHSKDYQEMLAISILFVVLFLVNKFGPFVLDTIESILRPREGGKKGINF